jgi:Protein of unknown function (DUF3485)
MMRIGFLLVTAALIVGEGLVYGLITNRWETATELPAAVENLDHVPLVVGKWKGTELKKLDPRVVKIAGFAGHLQRSYRKSVSRDSPEVLILLACGPFGPLSVHSPEVCYAASGFVQNTEKTLHSGSDGDSYHFWKAKFAKPGTAAPGSLWVFWSWNKGDGWRAAENARWTFAGAPVLYKLYVSCESISGNSDEDGKAAEKEARENCEAFIRELLPELEKTLILKP